MLPSPEYIWKLQCQIAEFSDQQAYRHLFTCMQPALRPFACSIIRSEELADEIVSDVFINIWEKRSQLRQIDNLRLYLYISTRNTALNYWKKLKKYRTFDLEKLNLPVKSIYPDPEQLMITSEMLQQVNNAIQALPPRCRLIFKLVKEDGLKHKEVAALLNLSLKTIENQVTLALKKLAETIRFDIEKSLPASVDNNPRKNIL